MHMLPGYFLRFPFGIISAVLLCLSCTYASGASARSAGPAHGRHHGHEGLRRTVTECPAVVNDSSSIRGLLFSPGKELRSSDTATLVFIGDVMLHAGQIADAHSRYLAGGGEKNADDHNAYDFSPYLENIRNDLSKADITVANMEFTLAGPPFTGYPSFSAPDSYAGYAADCGVDIFLTANNHICDKGAAGLGRTLDIYSRMRGSHRVFTAGCTDITTQDSPDILMMRINGINTAFLNFTYGTNAPCSHPVHKVNILGKEAVRQALMKAKEAGADFIIALPHWGDEYSLRHSVYQEEMAEWMAENGADIIIGTHPHVIQDYGTIYVDDSEGQKKVPVVYSLGNIISNMSARNTQAGLLLELTLTKDHSGTTGIGALRFRYTWCSLPGMLSDSYMTVFIEEWLDRKDEWKTAWDWTKMKDTYQRIIKETGIKDGYAAAEDEENH